MSTNKTQLKTIESMSLDDLIIPDTALTNIVENDELDQILSGYTQLPAFEELQARVEEIGNSIEAILTDFVQLTSFQTLLQQVESIQQFADSLSNYTLKSSFDPLVERVTLLEAAADQNNSTSGNEEPDWKFTGMKSTSTEEATEGAESTIRIGEEITIYGRNLRRQDGVYRLNAWRHRADLLDEDVIELDQETWLDDEQDNFTNDYIQLPSTIWNEEPFASAEVDDIVTLWLYDFTIKNSITINAKVVAAEQEPEQPENPNSDVPNSNDQTNTDESNGGETTPTDDQSQTNTEQTPPLTTRKRKAK